MAVDERQAQRQIKLVAGAVAQLGDPASGAVSVNGFDIGLCSFVFHGQALVTAQGQPAEKPACPLDDRGFVLFPEPLDFPFEEPFRQFHPQVLVPIPVDFGPMGFRFLGVFDRVRLASVQLIEGLGQIPISLSFLLQNLFQTAAFIPQFPDFVRQPFGVFRFLHFPFQLFEGKMVARFPDQLLLFGAALIQRFVGSRFLHELD